MSKTRIPIYLLAAVGVAAVLAIAGVPLLTLLPFAIVLACPLMMFFMMKGMGGTGNTKEDHTGHGCEHDPTRPVDQPARGT